MDIIKTLDELEKFKDYQNKILKFENSVRFEIPIILSDGWSIKAGWSIEAGGSIKAGRYIEAGGSIFSFTFDISAKKITTRSLPFYRKFWAEMPPLKKFIREILDEKYCWNDLQNIPTEKEKKEIVAWEGWHWILRGQLECFLGLKDFFKPPKE